MFINPSDRLRSLPPYIFSEINKIKESASQKGIPLLSLAIGDPDLPTPADIIEQIQEASLDPKNHSYSPYEGTLEFRTQVSSFLSDRFNLSIDPKKQMVTLIGSKEGIAHFPQVVLNPGDVGMYLSPGYPIYETSILLAGAKAVGVPLSWEHQFLPSVPLLEDYFLKYKPKLLILNFPSNPTSQVISRSLLEDIVVLSKKHGVVIFYDNAYSEIYFDEQSRPLSILEIPGAMDIAVESQSFSKTFNMTGWRLAYAFGNEVLVQKLLQLKTNIDSGPLLAVQKAGIYALKNYDRLVSPLRMLYRARRDFMMTSLKALNITFIEPQATFFMWCQLPSRFAKSMDFCRQLIEATGLVVTPGVGFGEAGEGSFRISLTQPEAVLREAVNHLKVFFSVPQHLNEQ